MIKRKDETCSQEWERASDDGIISRPDHERHEAGEKGTQDTGKLMKRESEASSETWKGTNDDGITEAKVKSPNEKDKILQDSLDQQERPRRHKRTRGRDYWIASK